MRYVDEFRDPELGRVLANEILAAVEPGRHYKFMEVCGGHTHSIYKYGVDDLLRRTSSSFTALDARCA
jgi:hydrogenase expression/formation protein HypD